MTAPSSPAVFEVSQAAFSGPFELLLSLIARKKLDITELALAEVADDFVAYLREAGFDLDRATEFLVVAATLLDLKAARLLPAEVRGDSEEDMELLEARDLLFARLLQYRAYKRAAELFSGLELLETRFVPRQVALEERFVAALPEVVLGLTPEDFAALAASARKPKPVPTVEVDHVHAPRVDVRAHARVVVERLQTLGTATFATLCAGCVETIEIVARFLALLELGREGRVSFDQPVALGELTVQWIPPSDEPSERTVRRTVRRSRPPNRSSSMVTSETSQLLPLGAQLEAVLLIAEEPVPEVTLAERLEVPVPDVQQTLRSLAAEYVDAGRGFELREVGGGWRFYTAAAAAECVERFVLAGQTARLSQAALETLAVVAYQQPVSRGRIAAVRGVNVDGVVRTLVTRRLIEEAGVDPEGGAMTYRTTGYFLERLGLRDLSELPPIAPLLPEADEIELP